MMQTDNGTMRCILQSSSTAFGWIFFVERRGGQRKRSI